MHHWGGTDFDFFDWKGKGNFQYFHSRKVSVREDTYPEPSTCEVGRPVPFLAASISPVLPPGAQLLLGEQ